MADSHEANPLEGSEVTGRTGTFSVGIDYSGTSEVIQVFDGEEVIWTYARQNDTEKALSAERIKEVTKFVLAATFTEFAREEGYISPDLYEETERLGSILGIGNVLPSFYTDEQGVIQLGLFVRRAEDTTKP